MATEKYISPETLDAKIEGVAKTVDNLAEAVAAGFEETATQFSTLRSVMRDFRADVDSRFTAADGKIDALHFEVKEMRQDIEELKSLTAALLPSSYAWTYS